MTHPKQNHSYNFGSDKTESIFNWLYIYRVLLKSIRSVSLRNFISLEGNKTHKKENLSKEAVIVVQFLWEPEWWATGRIWHYMAYLGWKSDCNALNSVSQRLAFYLLGKHVHKAESFREDFFEYLGITLMVQIDFQGWKKGAEGKRDLSSITLAVAAISIMAAASTGNLSKYVLQIGTFIPSTIHRW